jgi:aspartate aminotransferase-like enzyme
MPNRGYYFDFIEFAKNAEKNNTPSTPAISLIFGLQHIMGVIEAEGMEKRFARHKANNAMIHEWGARHGFKNFAQEGNQSVSLTCFHTPAGFDQSTFIKTLKSKHGFVINGGYGKIKGLTFRISNMGNETRETMQELIDAMDDVLG